MPRLFFFLSVLVAVALANEQLFNEFKLKHNKTYKTEAEHQLRYEIFNKNLQEINEHNANYEQGLVSWYKAVNQFSDMSSEEFHAYLTAYPVPKKNRSNAVLHQSVQEIPDSIDWRSKGAVTDVKDQGVCGACWTFSATGTLEAAYFLKNNKLVSLSEQYLIDCCTEDVGYYGLGCTGGVIQSAIDFVTDSGIPTEDSYPYTAAQGTCNGDKTLVYTANGYTEIEAGSEDELKNAVGSKGPVSVALNADMWHLYGGGIFSNTSCATSVNHGALVVGYGSENDVDYWIIKNSWGVSWGESGYLRMAIGQNLCNLASQACYPTA